MGAIVCVTFGVTVGTGDQDCDHNRFALEFTATQGRGSSWSGVCMVITYSRIFAHLWPSQHIADYCYGS